MSGQKAKEMMMNTKFRRVEVSGAYKMDDRHK